MAKTKRGSCWAGYHRVPGTKQGTPGSCAKNKFNMRTKKGTRKRRSRKTPKRRTNRRTN